MIEMIMKTSIKPSGSNTLKVLVNLVILVVMFALAVMLGAKNVSLADIWSAISDPQATGDDISIIRELRLPREVGAILVGAALAVAGAIMQGLTRNPLADPGLLGLTANNI